MADERRRSRLVIVPVAIAAVCCAAPALLAAGAVGAAATWLAAAHRIPLGMLATAIVAGSVLWWRRSRRSRHANSLAGTVPASDDR